MNDFPVSYNIKKIIKETPGIKTFVLGAEMSAEPGQFLMGWIPGMGEKPFAPTAVGKEVAVTVKKRGPFTEKMFSLKEGDLFGLRGPYGHGFNLEGVKKACIVSAGVGVAAVIVLAEKLAGESAEIDFLQGCSCKGEVLFRERIEKIAELHIATDDGSCGRKGYCTDTLSELLSEKKYDRVYCCGPEKMMFSAMLLCQEKDVKAEFSLERYMKCGVGVCGCCSLDEYLCCVDGPVFNGDQLLKSKEFGKTHYSKCGRKEKV